jgi:hypothetical protein
MDALMGEVAVDLQNSIRGLGTKVDTLISWKPELETRVAEFQTAVSKL